MNASNMVELINGKDFHVDDRGRVVIDNEDLMQAINGAEGYGYHGSSVNGKCANASCN